MCRFANTTLYSYPVLDDAAAGYDPAFRRRRLCSFAAGCFLLVGALGLILRRSLVSLLSVPVLVFAAVFLLYGYLSGRANQTAFRSRVIETAPSRQVAYEFHEEHFLTCAAGEERVHAYGDVTRWYRGKRTLTLCEGKALFILDRDGFSEGDAAGLCRFLAERAP